MDALIQRWERVKASVEAVASRAGREVTLVAISKTHSVEAIRTLYEAGQRHFGESRLQEAVGKIEVLPNDIVWHFVGQLQSNKARRISGLFDVVQTISNERQLIELSKGPKPIDVLIEVNIANEPQKGGISPENVVPFAQKVLQYSHANLRGLMTIGPMRENSEEMRPFFRELRLLNERIGGEWLSMGMSADYEVAIQEGSTHVRVGTAIFGER